MANTPAENRRRLTAMRVGLVDGKRYVEPEKPRAKGNRTFVRKDGKGKETDG